tara:strand:- start:643 stop:1260 length:618 start_codon:yes stop_codon:yes gene_type:complete
MINNYNFTDYGFVPYGKLVLKTAPVSTAITLAEAKQHLRVDSDFDDDNAYITSLIGVATNLVEQFTRRRLITQTYNLFYDNFPPYIDLQVGIIDSITHIKYYDSDNVIQTLAASEYDLDKRINPGRVYQSKTGSFPGTYDRPNAVEIEFVVGETSADVEDAIKQAMLITVGRYYEQRQDVVLGTIATELPLMVEYILTPYRLLEL